MFEAKDFITLCFQFFGCVVKLVVDFLAELADLDALFDELACCSNEANDLDHLAGAEANGSLLVWRERNAEWISNMRQCFRSPIMNENYHLFHILMVWPCR
jgi:hypothetical protein